MILISHNLVGLGEASRRGRWRTGFVKHCEPFPGDSKKEVCKLLLGKSVVFTGEFSLIIKRQLMSPELKIVAIS